MNSTLDLIIPTKDKGKILAKNLNYLSNISTAIRIVVLDSSSVTDESLKLELTSKSKLSEIIYVKTPNNFTGLQNFQEGEKYVTSDFFCFIGDDDIVTFEILKIIKHLEKNNLEACISSFPFNLLWKGYKSSFLDVKDPFILVTRNFTGTKKILNSKDERLKACKALSRGPLDLPRAYLGVCSSNILKKIHNDDKQLYNSISPDIYSSITISFYLDEYLKVDNPFIIPGASPGSASAAQAKNQEQDHLKRMENMYWSDMVPKINKEHCIWSNALIHSIEEYDLKIEDYSGLYSRLILSYPRYYRKINPSLLKQSNLFLLIIKSIFRYTTNIVQKLISKITVRPTIRSLSNLKDVEKFLNTKKIS